MRRARYRLGQFAAHLLPRPLSAADAAEVERILGEPLAALFRCQTAGEQAHALRVMRAVANGEPPAPPPELLQAALLHDVGKSVAPLSLPERSIVVLARRWAPQAAKRWGQGQPRGWRRPFVTAERHAEWGAILCQQAGAPALTVDLVRRHQAPLAVPATAVDEWLVRLQAADDDN